MFVKTVALLNQAFRVDVRQLRTHLLRGAVATAVLWILFMVHENMRWTNAPGREFFSIIVFVSLVLLSLAGAFYFPSVITEEKEQQTLGLLRMAGVGPVTLLVGKSLGRLAVVLLLLTITLPYWWLAVTLGGVTLKQVAASAIVLATHLILVSQIGTLCSVIFRTTGPAAVVSCLVIGGLMIGPPILYEICRELRIANSAFGQSMLFLWETSATGRLEIVLRSGYSGGLILIPTLISLAAAAFLFLTSLLTFDLFNTYEVLDAAPARPLERLLRWLPWGKAAANAVAAKPRKPRRATGNAIIWKDFQQFAGGTKWWVLRSMLFGFILFACIGLGLFWWYDRGRSYGYSYHFRSWDVGAPLFAWLLFFAGLEAVYLASHIFSKELRDQTWDSLRMLPVSLSRLCTWKVAGCLKAFLPGLAFAGLALFFMIEDWNELFEELGRQPLNFFFAGIYCIVSTLYALYLINFFSLKTNPWLGIVLAAAAWFFTVFSGFFCCLGVFDMDDDDLVFFVFWTQATITSILTFALHTQIVRMLRGDNAA